MKQTALIVIDVQQGLFEKSTPIFQAEKVLANINTLMDRARKNDVPVIFIQHSNDTTLHIHTPPWQLHPAIRPVRGETIIHKKHGNAFMDTDLDEKLKQKQINTLVVTGLVTHGCVKATTLGGLEKGYRVILVSDAHSNYSKDNPRIIQKHNALLNKKGAALIETNNLDFSSI